MFNPAHSPADLNSPRRDARRRREAPQSIGTCDDTSDVPHQLSHNAPTPKSEHRCFLQQDPQLFAERGGESFPRVTQPGSVTALVGSEGGWSDEEIGDAQGAGWRVVTLGGRTLRAETAAITVSALIQHVYGDLK